MADYREFALSAWTFLSGIAWLEWARAVFDLIKGVAWPLALFFTIHLFRNQLRERIPHLRRAGKDGVEFHPPTQTASPDAPEGIPSRNWLVVDAANARHPLPSAQVIIDKIRVQLDEVREEDRINKLAVSLAEAQLERQFEFIWGLIFGTQLTALNKLKEFGSVNFFEAKRYYDSEVRTSQPALSAWEFDQWAQFLLLQGLVDLQDAILSLTQYGRDFLVFVDVKKQGLIRLL